MATEPFLAQLNIFAFNFAPKGWAQCNGQLLAINQNQALFSLLGTTYGGNGQTNFALPNLQGRVPLHVGNGLVQGQEAGEQNHSLTISEMAQHTHQVMGSSISANAATPQGNFFASNTGANPYNSTGNESMSAATVSSIGGSQPHNNMSPYAVTNICIALTGIFPSRN
jgi:microcystin-dependent protein